ncbi:uncharacterized protein SRS1_10050 [Sporisorium reilianum f. sp. reilianum]|uniref:Uncharacterized protein n=1 Tax=Sporisorium reilianum f. sp. reilianum TaxID=72559 RepID=A0A2N8ULN4_9BASI|nr:uncharacterized protein SRS1_10050 [Sporisorium reilianum f. sp. reilianum]
MKVFALFTLVSTAMALVSATHSSKRSSQPQPFRVPATVSPFTGKYWFQLRLIPSQRQEYAARLRDHIANVFRVPNVDVSEVHSAISEPALKGNLNYDRNFRRFLYLGHTYRGYPDMVLATPLDAMPRADGSHVWALLIARKPVHRLIGPRISACGFVTVSEGRAVLGSLAQQRSPDGGTLEPGHLLNIDEVFEELSMLRLPSWEP